ncbi:16150_t:CDS:2 [Dentiscutata erythropus]|uniref:16150_t:CDS:1 n=1 Tax=Dentiscutata erythropus TaxID=1348616 RepID=A0A9N9EWA0_9GLOM|nr:16150_t:CDS:2 [Dentiscutata erythropus]
MSAATKKPQSKKHSGKKQRHYLTEYIITTDEYVNPIKPSDKFCYCQPWFEASNSENTSAKELGKIACCIFEICINSDFVERLFSCMGLPQKVLQMSQLYATMNYYHWLKEIEILIDKYKQNNSASPLPTFDKNSNNNSDKEADKTDEDMDKEKENQDNEDL